MKPPTNRFSLFSLWITFVAALASALAAPLTRTAAAAPLPQQQTDPDPPIFSRLFPNPTNNNGYEEFVRAADLIKTVDDINAATESGAMLEFKRHVMAIPACSKALSLIREGLAKQVKSPRVTYDENTLFPEFALFRKLARLMITEQYVDFADGRVDAAVDSLRVGLTFGYRIQTDTLISGLVGIAISSMVTRAFAAHVDQLSTYQCDDVLTFAKQLLEADSPGASIIEKEKSHTLQMLDKWRTDPIGLIAIYDDGDYDTDPSGAASFNSLTAALAGSPAGASSVIDATQAKMSALYDQAAANMRLPLSQRAPLTMDKSNTPAATLCRIVAADPQHIVDNYRTDQARIRLLAVHMLIRRYQWDHNALPASLAELHANDLVVDPFTGSTIIYKREGDRYTLASAGPFKQDENTGETTPVRSPVTLR